MKNYTSFAPVVFKPFILVLGFFLVACQQVPITGGPGEPGTTIIEEKTIVNNLCEGGGLDCIPTSNIPNSVGTLLASMYSECLAECFTEAGCSNIPSLNDLDIDSGTTQSDINIFFNGVNQCDAGTAAVVGGCQSNCYDATYGDPAIVEDFASADFAITPEDRAIRVEMKISLPTGDTASGLIFEGGLFSYQLLNDIQVSSIAGNPLDVANAHVGRAISCRNEKSKRKAQFKFIPHTGSSVDIAGNNFEVSPFPTETATSYEFVKYPCFQAIPIGVPKALHKHIEIGDLRFIATSVKRGKKNIISWDDTGAQNEVDNDNDGKDNFTFRYDNDQSRGLSKAGRSTLIMVRKPGIFPREFEVEGFLIAREKK